MPERILAVGIDPAKRQHQAVGVLYPDQIALETTLHNDVPDIEQLDAQASDVAKRHDAAVVYGVEDHRGLGRRIVEVLQRQRREIRVVNPLTANRQKAFYGEDKNDHVDARAIAAVVLRRREHLPDAKDRDEIITAIREAERTLQDLSEQRTKTLSRLHEQLGAVHPPGYHRFFCKLKSPWTLRFFKRFALAQDLEGYDAPSLAEVLEELAEGRIGPVQRHQNRQRLIERAEHILKATAGLRAQPRTGALELKAELVHQLCDEIMSLNERIRRLQRMLSKELLPQVEERVLITLPGVGESLAATVIGEIGDIHRFHNRNAFAKYNGTAPAENSSGGRRRHAAGAAAIIGSNALCGLLPALPSSTTAWRPSTTSVAGHAV